jgi:acetyl coenzyme A synthetase (ADP forming)-like protein
MGEYPSEYELDIVLRDGTVAHFRPIKPDDSRRLRRAFRRLGERSIYLRFFKVKPDLTYEEAEYFSTVDYVDRMALVVIEDDEIVGIGRYDRDKEKPDSAEVAFAVVDDHQHRGIGTELLQLLTLHARRNGIASFNAMVLAENNQMMRLFRNSGYSLERTLDEGVYSVRFPIEYSDDARRVELAHERQAVAASILPILYPKSIAVIGASRNPASIGGRLFHNLISGNFGGSLYPVNPSAESVHSVKAFPSVLDIPDTIDLAYIVVPARYVLQAVEECAQKKVRGLVVISAGFSEVGGEGIKLEEELLDTARDAGMRIVGPNCMGVLNTDKAVRLNGTFAPLVPSHGNVAFSSQSGALGIAILNYAARNNIGISSFVSVGNKADISGNDLLLAWEDDPATDVIALYLESFGNPRRFARLARHIAKKKPIVAVKSGRSTAGSRAASSHTGALASTDTAVEALFRQTGVIRTNTLEELFAVVQLLASQPVPKGRRVGVITNAGGPAILAADAMEATGLTLPELSEAIQSKLRSHLPAEAATGNPVDLIAAAGPAEYRAAIDTLLNSDEVDAVCVIYIPTSLGAIDSITAVIDEAANETESDKTILAVLMDPDLGPRQKLEGTIAVPSFEFPETAAQALGRAVVYGEWLQRPEGEIPVFEDTTPEEAQRVVHAALERMGAGGGWLTPSEVTDVLAAFGFSLPATHFVTSREAAAEAAEEVGGPVAVKVVSPSALHKTDVGGVLLGIEGAEKAAEAFDQVTGVVDEPEGALIQEMVPGDQEVLIGMTEDPLFGALIVYGGGGVTVELLHDVAFRIHPLTDRDATEMMRETRSFRLLEGYRGLPAADIPAVEETLLRVSAMIDALPELVEMDLNPVKVLDPGRGVRLVDARLRVAEPDERWLPEFKDLPAVAD